jgi:hypothetical protein
MPAVRPLLSSPHGKHYPRGAADARVPLAHLPRLSKIDFGTRAAELNEARRRNFKFWAIVNDIAMNSVAHPDEIVGKASS